MRHIVLSREFRYSPDPFPAFRCELVFGRNKFDRSFLPTKVEPVGLPPKLPDWQFRLIKKEKGTILIVPGEDQTNRALLFVGCQGGFRGGVDILSDSTTGQVIARCEARNALNSECQVIALLGPGQCVTFHTFGRRTDQVVVHTWTGTEIKTTSYPIEEWRRRNDATAEDGDVL